MNFVFIVTGSIFLHSYWVSDIVYLPKIENTTQEAMIEVRKSSEDTTAASMLILLWNLL